MPPAQFRIHRIHPNLRALRLHKFQHLETPVPRQFSHRPPRLLLVSHRSYPRPQLPFLYPGSQNNGQQVLRLFSISANGKKFIKETARQTVKYTFLIWCLCTSFTVLSLGILTERQERAFPSPHEWSFYTRFRFRRGKWWEVPENNEEEGFPNWARLYAEYEHALIRLENPDKDGEGIVPQEEGALLVPVLGTSGFDLTAKSEEWRQGYFEVLMGMARASERLEGWVSDKNRWNVWSPEFIASPSNPRPRATPPGMPEAPAEKDQIPVADPPENFYFRVLTSKGFTTHQRLTAALGYADWLSFKNLNESAEEMYQWALDIAVSGLPTPSPSEIVNSDTGVLQVSASQDVITPNLVYAATNLATFYASKGNITSALPIFISVLRARLNATPAPPPSPEPKQDSSLVGTVLSLLSEPEYPSLPPTGDEPLRRSEEDRCEEAALKNYIGEILFATAGSSSVQRQQGLNWVRDGVSVAKLAQSLDVVQRDPARKKKCEQCEEIGLESWGKIMTYLAAEARDKRDKVKSGGITNLTWKLWGTQQLDKDVQDLEDEEEGVTMRLNKVRGRMMREEYAEMDRKYSRAFAF
ncbi:hypothetical protein BU24DRAFT_417789 [Aaosphaeria arxii CBS 175.79]|uniref:MFS maltose permease n=1 Tax=Aaosphaeria arxii CBS 175.79 TaxID=1450172 RepID=A0A6A5YBS1_9PLEO|nr:uncharacterized protein BU24DRAFT_417789 [Aaosphaeria arxii CBS 175.79]KAF2022130.1 hypothetical protein BU24DRAFT_417789 [Aaosphaeria arxii CBS 175.79]